MRRKDGWGKKLHERHVQTILKFYHLRGWRPQALATRYNVTVSNIYQILQKQIWKDMEVVNG